MRKKVLCLLCCLAVATTTIHAEGFSWKMHRADNVGATAEKISTTGYNTSGWTEAIVPGTVLTSLVKQGVFPDPYYSNNNQQSLGLIPDISEAGRDFYTYWFRTEFDTPADSQGKCVWLQADGINYRAEIWVNGHLMASTKGMFQQHVIELTDVVKQGEKNVLAILVHPVDAPGKVQPKNWGAKGEWQNGGNGEIGANTTQLMTVGWDFTYHDGVRDRNTGIWRPISIYCTREVDLRHPFVKSSLHHPNYDAADITVSVEVFNPSKQNNVTEYTLSGSIEDTDIRFEKKVRLGRGEHQTVTFTPADFKQLQMQNPRLWWPKNKGEQNLYTLRMQLSRDGKLCDSISTRFGVREVLTTRETPDQSKKFIVNGREMFIRGTNWLPEAMLRTDDSRMEAEMRLTAQSGVNLLRLWGGGIAETDRFYELCDQYGLLVWQEFWMTGDTQHPQDEVNYLANVESTVKRIRNHPSVAFYVASNESSEVSGTRQLLDKIDGTRPYQMQSECDGVHDGSPYKQVNPMQHYENTASDRGSRVDGFNPEYGAPSLPLVESLRRMMPEDKLWPIDKAVWDYLDGNAFHLMTTRYKSLTDNYGPSSSIDEFAQKAQLLSAINAKSIWEVWNYNKLGYGDRFCSGLLFWYHNSSNPQVCGRMWDYYLEPTSALYHTMHALEPLHVQFDYLKNTVSVSNDYLQSFKGYTVEATLYTMDGKAVKSYKEQTDIPADGNACDVLKLDFPADITPVHFIYLTLRYAKNQVVSENFYWRSTAEYKGRNTDTGPCASGFEPLQQMSATTLKATRKGNTVTLKNTGKQIAFFLQLHLLDETGSPVLPAFYSDNFITLLPGQQKSITIESAAQRTQVELKGWNIKSSIIK